MSQTVRLVLTEQLCGLSSMKAYDTINALVFKMLQDLFGFCFPVNCYSLKAILVGASSPRNFILKKMPLKSMMNMLMTVTFKTTTTTM